MGGRKDSAMQRYDNNVDHASILDWRRGGDVRNVPPVRPSFALGLDLIAGHELWIFGDRCISVTLPTLFAGLAEAGM